MATTYGPYTPVRQAGNLLFVSGQVGVDPATKTASQDIAEQTRQVLRNLETLLLGHGVGMQDIVKTTVFLVNMDHFAAMNEVYEQAFPTPRPARSTVGVHELPRVAADVPILVEIEAVVCLEAAV